MSTLGIFNIHNRFGAGIEELNHRWGWYLALGLALIVLGVFATAYAFHATVISIFALGGILVVGGIILCGMCALTARWSGFLLSLATGILSIITGFILFREPLAGALALTLVIASLLLISGIFRLISSSVMRYPNWGWSVFSGIVSLILGILLFSGWPYVGLWFLGFFVGIDLVIHGLSWCMFALSIHSLGRAVERGGLERPAA